MNFIIHWNCLDTTPQAPHHIQYKQISSNLHLSWEAGYDGGRSQYFYIWYRLLHARKRAWYPVRVIPNNVTEFTLFDLQLEQTYELTLVAENEFGLGTFSPINLIRLNKTDDLTVDYLYESNQTNFSRPISPRNLQLSQSGSSLYIKWDHPNKIEPTAQIAHYVIQWRSMILFNNQQSQHSILVDYPTNSYVLKDVKQSKYIIQILAYSHSGTYSSPIESQINIRMYSNAKKAK